MRRYRGEDVGWRIEQAADLVAAFRIEPLHGLSHWTGVAEEGRPIVTWSRKFFGPLAFLVLLAGCDGSHRPTPIPVVDAADVIGSACVPEDAAGGELGQTVEIEADPGRLCRVVAVRVAELMPSADGSHPDPYMFSVARDRRGIIYTAATQASAPGSILIWGPDGSFRDSFGRPGEGPGELLGRSPGRVFIGRGDSVFVREAGRISVFGPDGGFGRVVMNPVIGRDYGHLELTEQGLFLSSGPVPGADPSYWFHVADAEGEWVRSFGAIDENSLPPLDRDRGRVPSRAIAYVGDGRFWAAPPPGAPAGYLLEEWTIDGELIRRFRRDASWMEGGESSTTRGPLLPTFRVVADRDGLLWVTAVVKDPRWRPMDADELRAAEENSEIMSELYDIRYEVIDPSSGILLASGLIDVFPGEDESDHPPIFRILPRASISYRPRPADLGFMYLEFFRLQLVR